MADMNLTYEFRELLRNCYFHPSREYPSMAVKLRARMAMSFLWQTSEIAIGNFRFSQADIRRILIDEMMPEHLDMAIECAKNSEQPFDFYEFALLVFECIIFSDAIAETQFELTYDRRKRTKESEVIENEAVNF